MDAQEIPERVRRRFWSRVAVRSDDECWPWRLSVGSHGYGQIGWSVRPGNNRMILAHRAAWVLTVGLIPEGMTVDHVCRNPRCCNPQHLRLLSNVDNARDNRQAQRNNPAWPSKVRSA